jgi:glucuronoarabinoxylan endo-1,4-beta-xylanase
MGAGGTSTAGSGGSGTGGLAGTGTGGAPVTGSGGSTGAVTVQLDRARQRMDGFGINDSWAPAMTDAQADQLFSTTTGIGLSILRVGMGSDGNPISGNVPGDITRAKARGVAYIIGSTWSPPANCKSNNNVNDGGSLNTNCYDSWSTTITNFARSQGLYAMSIANEPDFASCGLVEPCNGNYPTTLYTANQIVAFVKVAGPKLKAAGIRVIAPEASEWIHAWSNTSATGSQPSNRNSSDPLKCGFPATSTACASGGGYDYGHYLFRDAMAWAAFDIMGVHQYDTQIAEPWPADVTDKKPVWQTEMSGVKWWPEQGPTSDISNGVVIAGWIHNAITVGEASAWLWWWYQAQGTNDNEGLLLQNGTVAKRLYTLGNFSKFIRPGYTRVDIAGNIPTNVLLTAYKATDGTVVVVAINKGTSSITLPISISGGTSPASLTPWVTSATDNLASKTAVTVSGGSFTATLAGATVTTFVGK